MKKIILLISFLLVIINVTKSQEVDKKKFKKLFSDAEYFFLFEDYKKALPLYLKLWDMDSLNSNVNYRIGICYLQSAIEKYKSIPYLEKAIINVTKKYKEGSYKETSSYIDVYSYLGDAYRSNFDFDKAIKAYESYEKLLDVKDLYNIEKVKNDIQACYNAKELLIQSMHNLVSLTQVELLNESINTEYPEYQPVVSGNDSIMFFTSRRRYSKKVVDNIDDIDDVPDEFYMEDIYFSHRIKDGKWSKAERVTKDIGADAYTSTVSLSYDGKRLYLMRKDILVGNEDEGNIYVSEYKDGSWTMMKKLNENINTIKWETEASENKDGTVLYFTSERDGGIGGLDIYKSEKNSKGEWGPAQNLGPIVNTEFDEEYPVMLPNDTTLFFSSKGHYNIGGYDIFRVDRIGNNKWSVPINIGYPVNTMNDDVAYYPLRKGDIVYTALETADGLGDLDIYRMFVTESDFSDFGDEEVFSSKADSGQINLASLYKLNEKISNSPDTRELVQKAIKNRVVTLKGTLRLADNNKLDKRFSVEILDNSTNQIVKEITPDLLTGKYETKLVKDDYKITFKGKGYKDDVKSLKIPKGYVRSTIIVDGLLTPNAVNEGEYYVIKNIFFDYGKADLTRKAKIELEKLYKLMSDNPQLYIEVIGHTDSKSSARFNQILSEKRARSAINYLINKGIDAQRFVAKGVGETQHIAINQNPDGSDNPEGRALNRRVEIKILNSDNNKIIVEKIKVPENLKYTSSERSRQKKQKYTILLLTSKQKYTKESYLNFKETKTKDNKYIYTLGQFDNKSKALKLLNTAVDVGFPNAKIISLSKYNEMINNSKTEKQTNKQQIGEDITTVKTTNTNNNKVYTIQLKALIKPVDKDYFKGLKGVKEHLCKDGFYRYTYKTINNYEQAQKELKTLVEKGYTGAFIVDINKYNRLENKTDEQYTIQLKALRKPINIGFFSNLQGVQEHIGDDGLYKYTYGKYTKMSAAKKDLKKVIKKGYTDAFVVNIKKYK